VPFGPGGFCAGSPGCCSCSFFAGTFCLANTPELVCDEFAFICEVYIGGTAGFTPGACPTGFCSSSI
jgi:hypothetical protein